MQPELFPRARTEAYDFSRPLDLLHDGNRPLLHDLAKTRAFARLKDIRFLGAIDYCVVRTPNGSPSASRYTRQQHSLGVLRLALRYCKARDMSVDDQNVICSAALLHDIGHPPFSHSMEPVFAAEFGIDHHRATEDIICGRNSLGQDVLSVLRNHKVDIERVVELVAQRDRSFDGFFSGPITFDTIEGILRSYTYISRHPTPCPQTVMIAAAQRNRTNGIDQRMVDDFWIRKDDVYALIINSPTGILADFLAQNMLIRQIKQVGLSDYYGTELDIFRKIPKLNATLRNLAVDQNIGTVRYLRRTYDIDPKGDFYLRQDHIRYRQRRAPCSLDPTVQHHQKD